MNHESKVVLLNGGSKELIRSVVETLLEREATVVINHPGLPDFAATLIEELSTSRVYDIGTLLADASEGDLPARVVHDHFGQLDGVANLYVPGTDVTAESIENYVKQLKKQIFDTAELMAVTESEGMIVNQFLLPTLFADGPLSADIAAGRGAVSAYTRTCCIQHGKAGVRVVALFAGLLDLPETRALASERVNAATTPLGRWIGASDVAESVAFLTLDSGYMTGQGLILDGGMTSGITGT